MNFYTFDFKVSWEKSYLAFKLLQKFLSQTELQRLNAASSSPGKTSFIKMHFSKDKFLRNYFSNHRTSRFQHACSKSKLFWKSQINLHLAPKHQGLYNARVDFHFLKLFWELLWSPDAPEGGQSQYSPARKITNMFFHYFERGRLLCSTIYKIAELMLRSCDFDI